MSEVGPSVAETTPNTVSEAVIQDVIQDKLDSLGVTQNEANDSTPEVVETKSEKQKTLEYLDEYYGDQLFKYGSYVGTILHVLNACPVGRMMIEDGPEEIIAWIDEYKIEAEDEAEAPVEDEKEIVEDASQPEDKKTPQIIRDEAAAPSVVEKKIEKKSSIADKVSVETAESKSSNIVPEAVSVDAVDAVTTELIGPEVALVESTAPLVERAGPIVMQQDEDVEYAEAIVATSPIAVDPVSDSSRVLEQTYDVAEEDQIIEITQPTEIAPAEVNIDEALPLEDSLEAVVPMGKPAMSEIIENFEAWQELAEIETPLDEFLVTIVDRLNTNESYTSEFEEVLLEDSMDTELEDVALPELQVFLAEVRTVKAAIKKLYESKTKEECETHVDETVIALAELLRSFGYGNPEKMIRDFLAAHPLMSLQELLDELEQSIKDSIRHETIRQRQATHHKRHSSFGRLVLTVLQTLSLRSPTLDASV